MFDPHSSPFFGENLKLVSYCPLCENKHNATEAKVLDENEGAKLVYIHCKKCGTNVVAVVFHTPIGPFGMGSMGIVTDLTAEDVLKFREKVDIECDDAIELYEFFQSKPKEWVQHFQ